MSRTRKLAAIAAASTAAVALTASPAAAWTNGTFSANLSGSMSINGGLFSCSGSTMNGTINTAGTFSVSSATVTGCGTTVTPSNFPWSGSFNSGTVTISGFRMTAAGCTYGGTLSGTYTGSAPPATAVFTNQTVKAIGFCLISSVTLSATYVFTQP